MPGRQARALGPVGPARAVTVSAPPGIRVPLAHSPGRPCTALGPSLGAVATPCRGSPLGEHRVPGPTGWRVGAGGRQLCNALCRHWFCLRIRLFPTLLSVATQSYQWYSWGPPNMQCRLCASCWTYWKKYGGLKMPTRLDGERPGPNRSNMVSRSPPPCPSARPAVRPAVMALCWGGSPPSAEPPRHPSPEQREPQVCHEDETGLLPAHHQAHADRPAPVP